MYTTQRFDSNVTKNTDVPSAIKQIGMLYYTLISNMGILYNHSREIEYTTILWHTVSEWASNVHAIVIKILCFKYKYAAAARGSFDRYQVVTSCHLDWTCVCLNYRSVTTGHLRSAQRKNTYYQSLNEMQNNMIEGVILI